LDKERFLGFGIFLHKGGGSAAHAEDVYGVVAFVGSGVAIAGFAVAFVVAGGLETFADGDFIVGNTANALWGIFLLFSLVSVSSVFIALSISAIASTTRFTLQKTLPSSIWD
jgi:hypothetical protein